MLLESVLDAHGGRENWATHNILTAHAAIGGSLLSGLLPPPHRIDRLAGRRERSKPCELSMEGDLHRPFLRIFGATPAAQYAIYSPQRCEIRMLGDELQTQRETPFDHGFSTSTRRAPIDVVALLGAVLWNTLAGPFALTLGGYVDEQADGHLNITLPSAIDPISPRRCWSLDGTGLIRQARYALHIMPNLPVVETMSAHADFSGIRIPTLRRITRADGNADTLPLIDIEIFDLRLT